MQQIINLVADKDLGVLQDQLALADQEYSARKAEQEKLELEEAEAKAQVPRLMDLASACQKELVKLEESVCREIAALGEASDIAGHGMVLSKMRAKGSVLNAALEYHVERGLQGLRLQVMEARCATVSAEARQVENEALVCAKKLSATLLPALQDQGGVEIVSERIETLVRHSAFLWEKHAFLTAELKREIERQAAARALRGSTGGPVTRSNFVQ